MNRRRWLLVFAAGVVAAFFVPGLVYDRDAIRAGQVWRLATGHFAHNNWRHLLQNLVAAVLIAEIGRPYLDRGALWKVGLACVAGTSAGLWFFSPDVAWYAGLSGVLHGVLAFGVLRAVQRGRRVWWLGVAVLVAKVLWEQTRGPLPGSDVAAGGAVVVDAHLYGALCGLIAWYRFRLLR